MTSPFYLFLDFDGVLHTDAPNQLGLFALADRLGQAIAPYPEVRVVVSSSWREVHHLDEIREFCGPTLGLRLFHVTPMFGKGRFSIGLEGQRRLWVGYRGAHLLKDDRSFEADTPHFRFAEIAIWLAVIAGNDKTLPQTVAGDALARNDWAALDDTDVWFPPDCPQLIHVEHGTGLDARHLQQLEVRLMNHRRLALKQPDQEVPR